FEKDGNIEIAPGDLSSGQERNILIKFDAPTSKIGNNKLARAYLEYDDIAAKEPKSISSDLDYKVTKRQALVLKNENKEVGARAASVDVASEFYRAAEDYENGRRDMA
ncbi:MAG: hypothetical protein GWO07_16000, partial [Candidatus Dadabacteria bacterium]|nr:hypothetical protein [Candidatus Dadabacteria bacterium]NIS10207.1 hypothetical protein [Candidatus Dadabacteria bacterium]NIV42646.1 hypothetical protein [Candidatus Dadabacteria bacterium]NIY23122.1 hypothetical protein [Candidatus Dadabacteria bacterium]